MQATAADLADLLGQREFCELRPWDNEIRAAAQSLGLAEATAETPLVVVLRLLARLAAQQRDAASEAAALLAELLD